MKRVCKSLPLAQSVTGIRNRQNTGVHSLSANTNSAILIIFVLLTGFSLPSFANLYKCKDAKGNLVITDEPCETSAKEIISAPSTKSSASTKTATETLVVPTYNKEESTCINNGLNLWKKANPQADARTIKSISASITEHCMDKLYLH